MKFVANEYEPKDIIKMVREWTELTQKDFGKSINKTLRTVQDYEGGRRNYNITTLMEMAKKHNLTITIEKK